MQIPALRNVKIFCPIHKLPTCHVTLWP